MLGRSLAPSVAEAGGGCEGKGGASVSQPVVCALQLSDCDRSVSCCEFVVVVGSVAFEISAGWRKDREANACSRPLPPPEDAQNFM